MCGILPTRSSKLKVALDWDTQLLLKLYGKFDGIARTTCDKHVCDAYVCGVAYFMNLFLTVNAKNMCYDCYKISTII